VELIEPVSGRPLPWTHGAQGELVYTALEREAMPLLRFRSRDHVVVNMEPNPAGRTGPRIRCVGRTDDMLIVRGVNLFPTAIRAILNEFRPDVGELFVIRPTRKGVAQTPPLPITVELGPQRDEPAPGLAERIADAIRARVVVGCTVNFVRYGALPRETYKSRLVDFSNAA
jgi:phenylacetate-CoA ligase